MAYRKVSTLNIAEGGVGGIAEAVKNRRGDIFRANESIFGIGT